MEEMILQTKQLTKRYEKEFLFNNKIENLTRNVVDNVNMSIKRGEIYGLIGKNGAGKTTLIRLLAGSVFPTEGDIHLFGEEIKGDNTVLRRRMGVLIEKPTYWEDMTAYENLMISRLEKGIPSKGAIQSALDAVGLENDKKKVKAFSIGMKQKLGIAMAIIGEPELLILDEPTNGLDATSVVEMRQLLKRLSKEKGMTILMSSHILSELEQTATCYGFLHEGRLIEQISKSELEKRCKLALNIKVDYPEKAVILLEQKLGMRDYQVMTGNTIKLYEGLDRGAEITKALVLGGVEVEEISKTGETLERYFIKMIGENIYD